MVETGNTNKNVRSLFQGVNKLHSDIDVMRGRWQRGELAIWETTVTLKDSAQHALVKLCWFWLYFREINRKEILEEQAATWCHCIWVEVGCPVALFASGYLILHESREVASDKTGCHLWKLMSFWTSYSLRCHPALSSFCMRSRRKWFWTEGGLKEESEGPTQASWERVHCADNAVWEKL